MDGSYGLNRLRATLFVERGGSDINKAIMRELSLFSGTGGGLLGTKLLGWQHVGYVEWNDYRQRVLAQRILDGYLDRAPIFGDVDTFISDGYANAYQGLVDVVTGGFPCQPHSVAGRKRGADDPRDKWPQTAKVIEIVRPEYVFLENVPGMVSSGYVLRVVRDLEQLGYTVEPPLLLEASDCGAPHYRRRVWILAHAAGFRRKGRELDHGQHTRPAESRPQSDPGRDAANANGERLNIARIPAGQARQCLSEPARRDPLPAHAARAGLAQREIQLRKQPATERSGGGWWTVSTTSRRLRAAQGVSDGLADWVERVSATGDGQVPAVVAEAWRILTSAAWQS